MPPSELSHQPRLAAGATEDILAGARNLRRAFMATQPRIVQRGARLVARNQREPEVLLIANGVAYRSQVLTDGRRSILDILLGGDIVGLDHVVATHPFDEFTAASRLSYHALDAGELRRMMGDRAISLRVFALLAEARWRASRLAVALGRLDAQARIAMLLLDICDRLRRRDLISRPTYNMPLTQEQIADHLGLTVVHVNRTLRKLREEKLAIVDRQVVILLDVDRLRRLVQGLMPPEEAVPLRQTVSDRATDHPPPNL